MISIYVNGKMVGRAPERVFRELADVLSDLQTRIGRRLDPYGTTTLEPGHAAQLVGAAREKGAVSSTEARQFLALVEQAAAEGATILFEGE